MAINKRIIRSNDEAAAGASFNTVTWSGDGAVSRDITDVGFEPDFVWIKSRTLVASNGLYDSVRGAGYWLRSDSNDSEQFQRSTGYLNGFIADGFNLQKGTSTDPTYTAWYETNQSGEDYVAWCWKAAGYANTFNVLENGSTTSSATAAGAGITAGSNTTNYSVSANRDAGFSVVRFDAGSTAWNVGHGLDTAPSVIISKMYTFGNSWEVYHKDLGTGKFLQLSTTSGEGIDAGAFSSVTDTTWTSYTTLTSGSYIAYCFAEVAGFSKFGSYDGTGIAGNFQDCGFEPAFVMMKAYNTGSSWFVVDNKRNINNPRNSFLRIETFNAEVDAAAGVNFLGNGFEFTGQDFNDSGVSWIFMAFANQF